MDKEPIMDDRFDPLLHQEEIDRIGPAVVIGALLLGVAVSCVIAVALVLMVLL
jgi:hypothetical protein